MPRDEEYPFVFEGTPGVGVFNCSVYKEDVAITRIDIRPSRVDLEFEDGHKEVWFSWKEATRLLRQQYKLVKRK